MEFLVCHVDGWCPASSIQTWGSPHHKNQRVEWVVWSVHTNTPEWNHKAAYLWICVRHFCVCVFVCTVAVSQCSNRGKNVFSWIHNVHKLAIIRNLFNFTLSNILMIVRLSVSCLLLQTESSGFVLWYLHVCTDGEDNWGTSYGSLSVQPRHDQLCHHPATRQPERRGEAALDVSGSQLDTPTVSTCV